MASHYPSVEMKLSEVRYAQCTISDRFQKGQGSILELRDRLLNLYESQSIHARGQTAINNWFRDNGCVIEVMEHPQGSMKYYTMDNRRLWCVKSACDKLGVSEFSLVVLLQTKSQQAKNKHGKDAAELKMTTANDGISIVVQGIGQGARIDEQFGSSMKECQFFCRDGAIQKLRTDEEFKKDLCAKFGMQRITVELNSFDGEQRYAVSLIADEFTMQRQASAVFTELQAWAKRHTENSAADSGTGSDGLPIDDILAKLSLSKDSTAEPAGRSNTKNPNRMNPNANEFRPGAGFFGEDGCDEQYEEHDEDYFWTGLESASLPIDVHEEKIAKTIAENGVTIIRADTGSGKTTRVPLFVRHYHHQQHLPPPKILMTQPRRVATICAAQRMAESLGQQLDNFKKKGHDGNVSGAANASTGPSANARTDGNSIASITQVSNAQGSTGNSPCEIGYMIRGQSCGRVEDMNIAVCTTGWLLNKVQGEPQFLQKWEYIILDEVHERTIESDFMALICKNALLSNRVAGTVKLVVMSATVEAELFKNYFEERFGEQTSSSLRNFHFGPPPTVSVVEVPVHTHRKFVFYLDDLCEPAARRKELDKIVPAPSRTTDGAKAQTSLPSDLTQAVRNLSFSQHVEREIRTLESIPSQKRIERPEVAWETAAIVQELIQQLGRGCESILVVLPGLESIFRMQDHLNWSLPLQEDWNGWTWDPVTNDWIFDQGAVDTCQSGANNSGYGETGTANAQRPHRAESYEAFVLHSSIPIEDQERACKVPPSKKFCRVYLASNLAESSLTLPNVRVVIDTGLHRQSEYDPLKRTIALETRWVSQASAGQRSGRTGRSFAGVSIRLYPKIFYEKHMQKFDSPVINIASMEKTLLQVMSLAQQGVMFASFTTKTDATGNRVNSAKALLEALPTPPKQSRVDNTLFALAGAGAITGPSEDAKITMLGHTMLLLELEVELAVLVLHSILWGNPVDGIMTAAAASCDVPLIPESAGGPGASRAAEIGKRNKQLLSISQYFSESRPCEHTCWRNMIASLLLDFSDHKNKISRNATQSSNSSRHGAKGKQQTCRDMGRALRIFLQEWKAKYCDRPNVRRLENILNALRDLAEKVCQNTLDRGLQRDLRRITNLLSHESSGEQRDDGEFEETAALQELFETSRQNEFQGLLIAAFAPNFVALKSKLADGVPDISAKTNAASEERNRSSVSDAVLKEPSFSKHNDANTAFPTGLALDYVKPALQKKLAELSRSPLDAHVKAEFNSAADVNELTDDEDDINQEFVSVIKDFIIQQMRRHQSLGAVIVGEVQSYQAYQQLKRQVGFHNPRKLFEFLKSAACRETFTVDGYGSYAKVSVNSKGDSQELHVAAARQRAAARKPKKLLPKRETLRGGMTQTNVSRRTTYSPSQTENVLCSLQNSSLGGQLLELHKGRRPNVTFDYKQNPEVWASDMAGITIASVTSPFALKWQIPDRAVDYFCDSTGKLLPAWKDDAQVQALVEKLLINSEMPGVQGFGLGGLGINPLLANRNINAFTDNKLPFTLLGFFDKTITESLEDDASFRTLRASRDSHAEESEEFTKVSVPIEFRTDSIGQVIGKGGANLKELQEASGCSVALPPKQTQNQPGAAIHIAGPPNVVPFVKAAVESLLYKSKTSLVMSELRRNIRRAEICGETVGFAAAGGNSLETLARKMEIREPTQIFGVYQKASLNVDVTSKKVQSAVLTGVSVFETRDNPNLIALLLFIFGSSRVDFRTLIQETTTGLSTQDFAISRLQIGKCAVVDGCCLPLASFREANRVREEISKTFEECLPQGQEPRFVRSRGAGDAITNLLKKYGAETKQLPRPTAQMRVVPCRWSTLPEDAQKFMGGWTMERMD